MDLKPVCLLFILRNNLSNFQYLRSYHITRYGKIKDNITQTMDHNLAKKHNPGDNGTNQYAKEKR